MDALTANQRQRLETDGYLALDGIVEPRLLASMRQRLDELLAITPQSHAGTLVADGLLDEEVFDAAWLHERVLAAVGQVLGEGYRLLGVHSRGIRPGHGQQGLHVDWNGYTPPAWYMCHAICALVDFTSKNGATRVVPGSHRDPWMMRGKWGSLKPHPAERQLIGKAGTVFILNIHCAHSAVHNGSDHARLAIFSNFSRRDSPLLLANAPADDRPETLARHTAEIQGMLRA
jgi:ectoine hydroxylase-related dioxygenase (phytanoyl-CoA dioxygenase family)